MIRILHVIGKMDRGGAETMIMNYYRHIDRSKIQFDFLVHTDAEGKYDEEIESYGGRIYHITKFTGSNVYGYTKELNDFFKNHTEHIIVHGHIGSCAWLYLSIANKFGRITIAHSHNTKNPQLSFKRLIWSLYSYPTRFVADYYLACSIQAGVDRFGKSVTKKQFRVMNNAINVKDYIYSESVRAEMRNKLGIVDRFVIGNVGRLNKQKNHSYLLDIFSRIKSCLPDSVLILVGEGECEGAIREKVNQLNLSESVFFLGSIDYVPRILQAFDVFVFPSEYEGLGISAIEAQGSGLLTVCSDVIPAETRITDLCYTLSIKDNPNVWADFIVSHRDYLRRNTYDEIADAGFDIEKESEQLQLYYSEIISGRTLE